LGKDVIWDIEDGQNIGIKENIKLKERIEDEKEHQPQLIHS